MKKYRIVYPKGKDFLPVVEEWTEREIIQKHFDHWSLVMSLSGKSHLISYENCVKDWVAVHWAEEIE